MDRKILLDNVQRLNTKCKNVEGLGNYYENCKEEYDASIKEHQEIIEKLGTGTLLKAVFFYLLCIFSVILTVECIFDSNSDWMLVLFCFCCAVLFGSLGIIVQTYSYAKHDRAKNMKKADEYWNTTCISLEQRLNMGQEKLNTAIIEYENDEFFMEVPEKYRNEDAYDFCISAIKNRRADTEKEMYNLYEEELHRRRTIEIEEQKLEELQQMGVRCPKCNSRNCQIMVETDVNSTPFSFGGACCGNILLGPVGLLCGFCGMKTDVKTKTYYKCNSCGAKFNE